MAKKENVKKESTGKSIDDILDSYSRTEREFQIDTGIAALNELWGGGITPGYMYSFWGEAGCGKSTLSIQIAKAYAKAGRRVVILDSEKAVNDLMIDSMGIREYVDNKTIRPLRVSNYGDVEDILAVITKGDFQLVIWDSESQTRIVTPEELRVEDVRPGLKALQGGFIINKMKDVLSAANIPSLVLFHARANIVIKGYNNGSATKQAGGYAALHVPDIITKIELHGQCKENKDDKEEAPYGVNVTLVTTKNKFAAPFVPLSRKLVYGKGISKRIEVVDMAIDAELIAKGGGGYYTVLPGTANEVKARGLKALYDLPAETLKVLQEALSS